MRSTTTIETPKASVYLKQLCRHFGHRVDPRFDDRDGRIAFREELRVTRPEAG